MTASFSFLSRTNLKTLFSIATRRTLALSVIFSVLWRGSIRNNLLIALSSFGSKRRYRFSHRALPVLAASKAELVSTSSKRRMFSTWVLIVCERSEFSSTPSMTLYVCVPTKISTRAEETIAKNKNRFWVFKLFLMYLFMANTPLKNELHV